MLIVTCMLISQLDETERRCKMQQEQIFELKQELTNTTAELKLRLAQTEGDIYSTSYSINTVYLEFVCFSLSLKRLGSRHQNGWT